MRWVAERTINAAPDRVFATVADPAEFSKATGGAGVEYLTAQRDGVGTKFRASRMNKNKLTAFDQEVTEYVPGERIRLVNVTHGTPWDSVFAVRADGDRSVLTLTMDAAPRSFVQRLMMPLIRGMVQKALDKDMDAVKAFCER
jgi:uncharacterized protein YndB with AHSA1/START domain